MASVPTKYRKHSATQLTPKTERRRWSSTGGLADQPRLEPLESGVRAEMAQAVQGGCSDSFGWALNEAKLVVFDLASGRPVLHSVIPVSQLGLNASEPVEVVFPWQRNQGVPTTAIIVALASARLILVSLESGHVTHARTPEPTTGISAVAAMENKGVACGSSGGKVWVFLADPNALEWKPAVRLPDAHRSGGVLQAVFRMAAFPQYALGLFGRNRAQCADTDGEVVALLYSPVPRHVALFVVAGNGKIVQYNQLCEAADSRVVLHDLTDVFDRTAVNCRVVAATLGYTTATGTDRCVDKTPTIHLLVSYTDVTTGSEQLSLCRVVGLLDSEALPLYKAPTPIGQYGGKLSIFVHDGPDGGEEDQLILVSVADDRTQVVRLSIGDDNALQQAQTRVIPGRAVAVTAAAAPIPAKLTLVTREGWATESAPSDCVSTIRAQLSRVSFAIAEPHADAGRVSASGAAKRDAEYTGDFVAKSNDIAAEPVSDFSQWQALDDTVDRMSHMILRRTREKQAKHKSLAAAAITRGLGPEKLRIVLDNDEKVAVTSSFRELQMSLYSETAANPNTAWQPKEFAHCLTQFSKTLDGNHMSSRTHELRLTQLQRVYTEAGRIDEFFPFLAQWVHETPGPSTRTPVAVASRLHPSYLVLFARVMHTSIDVIRAARAPSLAAYSGPRWTHSARFVAAVHELISAFKTGLSQIPAFGVDSQAEEETRDAILSAVRAAMVLAIEHDLQVGAKRVLPSQAEWVRSVLLAKEDFTPTTGISKKSRGFAVAQDVGWAVADYPLLVSLALLLVEDERKASLMQLHESGPEPFFKALVQHFSANRKIADLLAIPTLLDLDSASNALFASIADQLLPASFPLKYAVVGPSLTEKTPDDASAALVRCGKAMLGITSARPPTRLLLHRLKLAKFALAASQARVSTVLEPINAAIAVNQIQTRVLNDITPHILPTEDLLNKLITGPSRSVSWEGCSLAESIHPTAGHKLAWAFPLSALQPEHQHAAAKHQIWLKALVTPQNWWLQPAFRDFVDVTEGEQAELASKTHFYHVYRTVVSHPQIESAAFRGDRNGVLSQLQQNIPESMPAHLFALLVEVTANPLRTSYDEPATPSLGS